MLLKQLQYFYYYITTVALAQPCQHNNYLAYQTNKNLYKLFFRAVLWKSCPSDKKSEHSLENAHGSVPF